MLINGIETDPNKTAIEGSGAPLSGRSTYFCRLIKFRKNY